MNKEKQIEEKAIEEMAKVICLSYGKGVCRQCDDYDFCTVRQEAERLYAAGYRKQSNLSPCDVCIFNQPSSCDGKTCTVCPAQMKGGAE